MATGEVTTACPHCGQRLRAGWLRCPRCQQLAPEATGEAEAAAPVPGPESTSAGQSPLVWLGAAAAVVVAVLMVGMRAGGGEPAAAAVSTRPSLQAVSSIAGQPRPVDSSQLAHSVSGDEQRAGIAAYAAGDLGAALSRFQAAVDAKPDDPEARNSLAQVLVRQQRAEEALPHFDEAIRLDPQKWAYRFNRGRAYDELKRYEEAIPDYRAASDMFPDDYATHYNLGLVYLQAKQYAEAVASLERAVTLAPGEPSFLISLGTAYVAVEQPNKAKATFETFLEVAADDDPEVARVKALIQALEEAKQGT